MRKAQKTFTTIFSSNIISSSFLSAQINLKFRTPDQSNSELSSIYFNRAGLGERYNPELSCTEHFSKSCLYTRLSGAKLFCHSWVARCIFSRTCSHKICSCWTCTPYAAHGTQNRFSKSVTLAHSALKRTKKCQEHRYADWAPVFCIQTCFWRTPACRWAIMYLEPGRHTQSLLHTISDHRSQVPARHLCKCPRQIPGTLEL